MSDNQPFRSNTRHLAFLAIPCLSLALTLAAFCYDAPSKLARVVHAPEPLEFDATIRYEPAVAAAPAEPELVASK